MRARRRQLFAAFCFAALAVASAGCGNPQGTLHTLVEETPTEAVATATAVPGAPSHTKVAAEDTPPPASATSEPAATLTSVATPTGVATAGIEPTTTVPPPCRKISVQPWETLTPGDPARGGDPVHKPFLGVNLVISG
jgi:hypothetical protein